MAKKAGVTLDGMIDQSTKPTENGHAQRGAVQASKEKKPKRVGEKRLTLALDGATYRRLRLHAVETDQTHQDILELALTEYLNRANK